MNIRDVDILDSTWRKSTRSGSNGDHCVEVAKVPGTGVAVRNSKHPEDGELRFEPGAWGDFVRGVADGEFD